MDVRVDGHEIELRYMEKPRIKNAYLRFSGDVLVVTARNSRKAEQIISENRSWIEKHYRSIKESARLFDANSMMFGGSRLIALLDRSAMRSVEMNKDVIIFHAKDEDSAERLADRWLAERSMLLMSGIANSIANENKMAFNGIKMCRGSRWGSCSSRKELRFNRYMCMVPVKLAEYVAVHELAHTIELNHSASFWKEVGRLCPEYRSLRRELKRYDSYRRRVFRKLE